MQEKTPFTKSGMRPRGVDARRPVQMREPFNENAENKHPPTTSSDKFKPQKKLNYGIGPEWSK